MNLAKDGDRFCNKHSGYIDESVGLWVLGGVIVGNIIVPGIGGTVIGGVLGYLRSKNIEGRKNMKKRVFVSFDYDNDRALKDFIIAQSRLPDSPFSVIDHSLKEAAPERDWEAKAKAAISRSEVVLVMVGPKSHTAQGVLKEVRMARELGRPIYQIIGYRDGNYTAVKNAGRLYRWNWPNLKKLLS